MSELAAAPTEPTRSARPRAATRQAWVERLARFPHSGLSPAQFCASEGVSLPSFYSWKRRLAAEASPAADDPGPRLLAVRLQPQPAAVEVTLPTGAVLRIPPGCDLTLVRSLVAALGDAPC